MSKDLNFYMTLPYTVILKPDEDGDYIARILELEGCLSHGETPEEAISLLNEVKELWIADALDAGHQVPEPKADEELPSGRWLQRVPRTLHKQLIEMAKKEKTSLNQLCVSIMASATSSVFHRPPERHRVLERHHHGIHVMRHATWSMSKVPILEDYSVGPILKIMSPPGTTHYAESVTHDARKKKAIH